MPEELKTLHVRITGCNDTKVQSYSEQVDLDEQHEMWEEWVTNGANPDLEKMTFEHFHREVEFPLNQLNQYNGSHFIFGFLESLWQSDNCPSFMYDDSLTFEVEVTWNE
jgi:hypothetical protein